MNHQTLPSLAAIGQGLLVAAACAQPCGNPWTQWSGTPPSWAQPVAYDSARHKVVFFGGYSSPNFLNSTWEWDPSVVGAWTERTIPGPSPRRDAVLAYDSVRQRMVMFGGRTAAGLTGETWEWDGTSAAWVLKATTGPSARIDTLMVFDQARGKTVLFGNGLSGFPSTFDTWEWDGASWTLVLPTTAPVYQCMLTYDAALGKVLMIGADSSGWGVWEWSGAAWVRTGTGGLPDRFRGRAVFDPVRARTLLIGRSQPFSVIFTPAEFWEWDGSAWSLGHSTFTGVPPSCCELNRTVLAYDGTGVVFVDNEVNGVQTWRYSSTLSGGPNFLQVPFITNYEASQGATVVFSALSEAGATYQWRRSGVALVDGGHIAGATSPALTISSASGVDTGLYTISATNACGTTTHGPMALVVVCYANCDYSYIPPILTASDFICFLNVFAAGCTLPNGCNANCDGSTSPPVLNVNDFNCFLNKYAAGCP